MTQRRLIEQAACEGCGKFHEGDRIIDPCSGPCLIPQAHDTCSGGSSREVTVDLAAVADEIDGGIESGPFEYRMDVARKLVDLALGGGR